MVRIHTAAELGRLRETLPASPSIAAHIRHFSFSWDMGGDYYRCKHYSRDEGTLVQLAFRDRKAIWRSLLDECRTWAEQEASEKERE